MSNREMNGNTNQIRGVIKVVKRQEGFCFITDADGNDYFGHRTAFQKTNGPEWDEIEAGAPVQFTPIPNGDKLRAIEIRVLPVAALAAAATPARRRSALR